MLSTLIVGSGPSGLILALALSKNGVPVRIIEKRPNYPIGQRGSGIQSRTLELYKTLGILSDIQKSGGEIQPIQFFTSPEGPKPVKEMSLLEHLEETPEFPLVNTLIVGQDCHEAIIRKHLAEGYNIYVELGTELKSFTQTDEYVESVLVKRGVDGEEVEETVRTEFLVGTDGARSTVRKQLGLTFLGESHEEFGMVVGDLHIKSGIPNLDYTLAWGDMKKAFVALRPFKTGDDRFNFLVAGPEIDLQEAANDREVLYKQILTITGRELEFGDLIWSGLWRANVRMVTKFGVGRVFIGGDAAHVHSPTGGQGMNSGVQDSINLAWKIALVHHRHSPLSLLDSYTDERVPVIATMLNKTTALMNLTFRVSDGDATGINTAAFTRGFELRQLGVNYRGSSVVVDEKYPDVEKNSVVDPYRGGLDGTTKAGYRAPAAPGLVVTEDGSTTTLFDLFSATKHTVLVFASEAGVTSDALSCVKSVLPEGTSQSVVIYSRSYSGSRVESSKADHVVVDHEGYAFKHYNVVAGQIGGSEDKFRVFVIRPDGYIGAIVEGEEGLKRYGKLVFGVRS